MRAAVQDGPIIRVVDVPEPRPGPGEVLVAVRAAGICGSDLHRYRGFDPWTPGAAPGPRRFGHEFAGVVAALGEGVGGLVVGQPVAVEPMQLAGCGRCPPCRRGLAHICVRPASMGPRRSSAGFSELDVATSDHVHPVAKGLPLDVAALADVYACAGHALNRVPVGAGEDVVVIGTGPVGLALGQLARRKGVSVTVLGRRREALAAAERVGAAGATIDVTTVEDVAWAVGDATSGRPVAAVFEAAGGPEGCTAGQALELVSPGGTIGILGAFEGDVSFSYRVANRKEVTVRWCNGYSTWQGRREFAVALERLAEENLDASSLITHRFGLEDIAEAFRAADDRRRSGAIKVVIEP